METYHALYRAVKEMRQMQREYFKTRDNGTLKNAKEAEKDVDRLVEIIDKAVRVISPQQKEMF